MTLQTISVAPIRIEPPEQPLTGLRWLRTVVRNPIEAWPAAVYREPMVVWSAAGRQIAFVMAPELVREVLLNQADAFDKGEISRRTLKPALGDAILTSQGAHWRWQRRAAAPAFRAEHIAQLAPVMRAAAEQRAAAWHALPDGTEVNIAQEMMRTTFDVILDAMLSGRAGMDAARIERAITEYLSIVGWVTAMTMMHIPAWVPFPGSRAAGRARAYLKSAAAAAVRQAREAGAGNLMRALADATDPATGRAMSDKDLADNFLTFMSAGHETTALALTWTFYLLGLYPAAEQRVLEEIERVTGGEPLQAAHVDQLAYTRQVLEESMRLYPPVALMARRTLREVRLDGRVLAAGTPTFVPIYAIHRHELLWDEPDRFDPERFGPGHARDRYAYLPFGSGPRICIGMGFALTEAAVILAALLRSFRLALRPGHRPRMQLRVTLRPAGGMPMRLYRRHGAA
jgi:cytochrome P450